MIKINFPAWEPNIKTVENKDMIFDDFRKQWVLLTPEEWVRQNFLQYMVQVKNYPAALIAVEKEINLNGLKKRFDIVVYSKATHPWLVVECKEMNVALTASVLDQVMRYNMVLKANYLVVTNGLYSHAFDIAAATAKEIDQLPDYQ